MGREFATATDGRGRCKPRLFIEKMVLVDFKSYAGKQHIVPFHKCFSAVVGPNGSGKSNVIDAMLFIFGKRAKQVLLHNVKPLLNTFQKSSMSPCSCQSLVPDWQPHHSRQPLRSAPSLLRGYRPRELSSGAEELCFL